MDTGGTFLMEPAAQAPGGPVLLCHYQVVVAIVEFVRVALLCVWERAAMLKSVAGGGPWNNNDCCPSQGRDSACIRRAPQSAGVCGLVGGQGELIPRDYGPHPGFSSVGAVVVGHALFQLLPAQVVYL